MDQLIEEYGVMAENRIIVQGEDYTIARVDLKDPHSPTILAIRFNKTYPLFKQHAKQTSFEGDTLDKHSYMQQFERSDYVYDKSYVVRFENGGSHRCLCIDVARAKAAGVNLEGFGIK